VIGIEFPARLLREVASIGEERLSAELQKLIQAELVFEEDAPSTSYRFKHALIQEAAYQSLVRAKRQQYHRQIAHTLQERFPDIAEAQPELLAHHFSNADVKETAIEYWRAASEKAMRRSASLEAISHLTKAQESLNALPDGPERLQKELALQVAIGTPLIATRGFASPEVGRVYARAREICELTGFAPQLFPVLWGLWVFYTARAEHRTARELAEQCRRMAEAAGDPIHLMLARHAAGVTLSSTGEHAAALRELEQVIDLYDRKKHASLAFSYGQDSGVVCRSQMAFSLWLYGRPEQALKMNAEALALAGDLSHPYSHAAALVFSAWIHQLARDSAAVQAHAQAAIAISTEKEFPFWLLNAMILHGWALTASNQVAEGIALLRQARAHYQQTGARVLQPYYSALLAQALVSSGDDDEATALLNEAEIATRSTGEGWFEPEIYRLKGEAVLRGSTPDRERIAENYFEMALQLAARQAARSLELRAATSLARLRMGQRKTIEAKQRLAEIYNRFTEGFDLPDLRDAREVLEA
jgi:predicted ATPase